MRLHGAAGQSLAETLLVLALLGITVLAFTPFQVFLLRSMGSDDANSALASPSWTARHLAADARAALDARVVSDSSVRFTLPASRAVTWATTASGALERVEVHGGRRLRRAFAGNSLRVKLTSYNLLSATVHGAGGRQHELEVWLRHAGRP